MKKYPIIIALVAAILLYIMSFWTFIYVPNNAFIIAHKKKPNISRVIMVVDGDLNAFQAAAFARSIQANHNLIIFHINNTKVGFFKKP